MITQSVRDINGNIAEVVDQTFRMVKLTKLGLDKSYRVEIYEGCTIRRSDYIREFLRKYDPVFFPMYKSHSQKKDGAAEADESRVDNRGNALKSGFFKFGIPLALVMFIAGFWGVRNFFTRYDKPAENKPVAEASPNQAKPESKPAHADVDSRYRVAGVVNTDRVPVYVLVDGEGRSRFLIGAQDVKQTKYTLEVRLPSGEFVTSWDYPKKSEGLIK